MGDIRTRFSLEGEQQYRSAMTNAANAIKVLNAEQKLAAAQFKNTGDAEKYAADKAQILQQKITQQKKAVEAAEAALKELSKNGVSESSKQFQQWQIKLTNAQTALTNMETELGGLTNSMSQTAKGAEQLTTSINGIGKKISLDQVISGIGSITSGLENAAKKAVDFGEKLFDTIMDSAAYADDIGTLATNLGLTPEEVQKMQIVAPMFEATAQDIGASWKKMRLSLTKDNDEVMDALYELKVDAFDLVADGMGQTLGKARDWKDVWWEVGEALMNMEDQTKRERLANTLLGKSWDEMSTIFTKGREEYEAAMAGITAASDDAIDNASSLNDRIAVLEGQWETLKLEVIGAIAPALEKGAEALGTMLDNLTVYLQTEEGQQMLERLGTAVSGLFEDLSDIDPGEVVEGFTGVFNEIVKGLEWLDINKQKVIDALKYIVMGWAGLKLTGGVLDIVKVVTGLGDLLGVRAAGAAAGSAWGGAFAHAVLAAAPWLAGLITLLTPANTESNSLADAEGNLTEEGWYDFLRSRERASQGDTQDNVWYDYIMEAGEIVEEAARLWDDAAGIQALAKYAKSGNREQLAKDLEALGYVLREIEETNIPEGPTAYVTNDKSTAIHKDRRNGKELLRVDTPTPQLEIVDVDIQTLLEAQPNAAEDLEKQVGEVVIPVKLAISGAFSGISDFFSGLFTSGGSSGGHSFANGLPWVPYDGYLSVLHRGERVLTASENRNYTYNSNTYFGNVNLNNGLEIDALTDSIARQNRRQRSGYGT